MEDATPQSGPMEEPDILKIELDVLRRQHRQLDEEIQAIECGPAPDAIRVGQLKRRKLAMKDEITRLEDRLYPDILA